MTDGAAVFRKERRGAPAGFFAWEAAGLGWLADARGAAVVEVLDVGDEHLDLRRLRPVLPTREAGRAFGHALARTHATGATSYGVGPPRWDGDGFFGPLHDPLPLVLGSWERWGSFYAEARVAPLARLARDRGLYDGGHAAVLDRLCSALADGLHDTEEPPARIHGDLWSGNLMWTAEGAVLIDPAAHGGHRENDLALLHLFGAPHLDELVAGYQEQVPLVDGWRDRIGLHQLHCLLVHAVLFGGGYAEQALTIARRYA